jgi:tRNA-intron endonuclease
MRCDLGMNGKEENSEDSTFEPTHQKIVSGSKGIQRDERFEASEFKAKGILMRGGVKISDKSSADALSQRGYGVLEKKVLLLCFYEALYLMDKGVVEVRKANHRTVSFRELLECYEKANENAWACYLVFRDLRSRGYVVREGFGAGVDFRVYERGDYSKDTAKYLVVTVQEGKPVPVESLSRALTQSLSLKKELVLGVMNRRGEIVYYSVSELSLR